ncbi:PD-(D/E)XK motif protein [Rugosimonospora africana]|uniref:PD-(D/E)XK family member n=1 Tax=Rugosimonospora africana TaxID=556532 RepID=A0A8J3R2X2_9ACTN|nr:PD-(D/E)XK motif protein [Rugosimonospora africana]GIH20693.1 hypothetical protein Raf01_88650 [Rugosimonospora africana]
MPVADRAETVFGLLEHAGAPTGLRVRQGDTRVAAGPVAHGIDVHGRRHLLVPLAEGERPVEDTGSRGVRITTRRLVDEPTSPADRYVDVSCEMIELRDLFAVLVDEMTDRLAADPDRPGLTCLAVLDRWRDLLGPSSGPLLGAEKLAGLLAELHFMEQIAAVDAAAAVGLWTGPDAGRADFTAPRAGVEVKATTLRDSVQVDIHGIGQLQERPGTRLYLYVEKMERGAPGGDTVPDAVDRLLGTGIDRHGLLRSLTAVGYRTVDAAAYRAVAFGPGSRRTYLVSEAGFPRIIPGSLTEPGVLDHVRRLRYTLDLTAVPGALDDSGPAIVDLLAAS